MARGALIKLPASYRFFGFNPEDLTDGGDGAVAYTATDGLPHLYRCH